ncbi:MAG: TIGR01777 family oxidoreductase [Terracidiphilus sp.]
MSPANSSSPAPRFLLSGASGMLGTALKEALTARGSSAIQLVRSAPTQANELQWDPTGASAMAHSEGLEHLSAAVHLSGANLSARRWTPEYKREIVESRTRSTHTLATTLAGLRHPPRIFLIASAPGIYGNRGDELIDETSPLGTGFLADCCQQWEAAAQPAVDAGMRVLHLRFGVVLNAGPGTLARLLPIFRLGLGARLGNGHQFMSWISLPDALAAIFFLLDSPSLAGPINLTSPNPVTNDQFTSALAAQLHRPALLSVPGFALRLALGEMADVVLLSSVRAYPAKLAAAGFQFSHASLIHALPAVLR